MNEALPHPSLARARTLGLEIATRSLFGGESNLLASEPDEESLQVAIVVRALVQHRGVIDERVWLSQEAVRRLTESGLQEPKRDRFERYAQRGLAKLHNRYGKACTHCTFKPAGTNVGSSGLGSGRTLCSICSGTGRTGDGEGVTRCMACNATGVTVCGPCDGTGRVFDVTARTLSVGVGELEFVFLPAIRPALHQAISRFLLAAEPLPETFAFDIDRPIGVESSSYRTHVASGPPRIYGIEVSGCLLCTSPSPRD